MISRHPATSTSSFIFLVWFNLALFSSGPNRLIGGGGVNIVWGDIVYVLVCVWGAFLLLRRTRVLPPHNIPLFSLYLLYVGAVLIFPLLGILYFSDYLSWYFGDVRWVQIVSLFFFLAAAYNVRDQAAGKIEKHAYYLLWGLVLLQLPILLSQISMGTLGFAPNALLEFWYPGGDSGLGRYGYYINRYAGALGVASGLALLGAITVITGVLRITNARIASNTKADVLLTLLGMVYMLAAANRGMWLGVPAVLTVFFLLQMTIRGGVSKAQVIGFVSAIVLVAVTVTVMSIWNIGRLASGRHEGILQLVTGESSFSEVSGRGGEVWSRPIQEAMSEWTPIGTLVNSVHALQHLPGMDSYFVVIIAQAGPFIIVPFLLLGLMLAGLALKGLQKGRGEAALVLAIISALLISSITQNAMLGLFSRIFLSLAVFLLVYGQKDSPSQRAFNLRSGGIPARP